MKTMLVLKRQNCHFTGNGKWVNALILCALFHNFMADFLDLHHNLTSFVSSLKGQLASFSGKPTN